MAQENLYSTPVPPNGIAIAENLYLDKTEITNLNWLEYLYYLYRDSTKAIYEQALPDTTVWLSHGDTLKFKYYLRYPSYRSFPVVGITQEQAMAYCAWRSIAATEYYNRIEKKKQAGVQADQKVIFKFRLPTEAEWMNAASGHLNNEEYPFGVAEYLIHGNIQGKAKTLYDKTNKRVDYDVFLNDLKEFRKEKNEPSFNVVKSFKDYFQYGDYSPRSITDKRSIANPTGVIDMIGNVAELVQESNFVKGGSWAHDLESSKIKKRQAYKGPAAWIGFRCICEVEMK
ncbi:MAG: SUMF1/EgtB/PvdO family nonheme iron enzyme [Cyclobacteriaceae bacterium]|nr:SUMF1/EgtB/PvdO family nonheme iron enzyme [Cyclobacteriaceae bacterium]